MDVSTTMSNQSNITKTIDSAIQNKSKRSFSPFQDELVKQANVFSPTHHDFILKLINSSSLKIIPKPLDDDYSCYIRRADLKKERISTRQKEEENTEPSTQPLRKKARNTIEIDISDPHSLPYTLGLACNLWFGDPGLTSCVILQNGETLEKVFTEEFKEKHQEIYRSMLNDLKSQVSDAKAYETLKKNASNYQKLIFNRVNHGDDQERKVLQRRLYKSGFMETYYQFHTSDAFPTLHDKYSPVLNALVSSNYSLASCCLDFSDYYDLSNSNNATQCFFAHLFAAKVTSSQAQPFELLKQLLPKSLAAFEELFHIFLDHIQNNRRFTKKEVIKDESK